MEISVKKQFKNGIKYGIIIFLWQLGVPVIIILLFYVAMKQPKSQSAMRNKTSKRLVFPTVRHSKQTAKLQQFQLSDKSELFFNMSLLPFDINLLKQEGNPIKILVTSSQITVHIENSNLVRYEMNKGENQWLCINFGENYRKVKVKKFGDESVFGKNMIVGEKWAVKSQKIEKVDIKEIAKKITRTSSTADDKTRDIKKFVSSLMSKKINARKSQPKQAQTNRNLNLRRNSGIVKNRLTGYSQNQLQPHFSSHKFQSASTAISSFRKDIVNESKYTKASEKQTNVSYDNRHLRPSNISSDCDEYLKMKLKFDTQPYFRNTGSFQSSQAGSTFHCQLSKTKCEASVLEGQSLHRSEEEESVEEEIKRSGISMSANEFESHKQGKNKEGKGNQESSSCYESEQLESGDQKHKKPQKQTINGLQLSGTLCQSRYQ